MKINRSTWTSFLEKFGEFEARRRLRYYRLERQHSFVSIKRCPLALASEMAQMDVTPLNARKKYKEVIRSLIEVHRSHRLRIESFLLPWQSRTRLPD